MQKCDIKNMLYKCNLKSRALSVILYLLDRSNKDLVCFPSIKTISKDLNISVSTTKRALNSLVETGFIEKIERFLDTTGKQTSNLYIINVENLENIKNVEKIEKATEEKEILEIFEEQKEETTENNVLENQDMILESKDTLLKNKIRTEINKKDKRAEKHKVHHRKSTPINIVKKLTIIELIKIFTTFKYKNFKNDVLKKIKNINCVLNYGNMDYTPVHFYTPYNLQFNNI